MPDPNKPKWLRHASQGPGTLCPDHYGVCHAGGYALAHGYTTTGNPRSGPLYAMLLRYNPDHPFTSGMPAWPADTRVWCGHVRYTRTAPSPCYRLVAHTLAPPNTWRPDPPET